MSSSVQGAGSQDGCRSQCTCLACLLLLTDDETLFSCNSVFSGNGNARDAVIHSKEALESVPAVHDPESMELRREHGSWSRWASPTVRPRQQVQSLGPGLKLPIA